MRYSNFAKITFRNIFLHRGFSLVSLIGLSIGIAISMLVLAYVDYETSYDKHFNDSENIYRLKLHETIRIDDMKITKVFGGWIYRFWKEEESTWSTGVFVYSTKI